MAERLEIGDPVEVHRGGDPAIPVAFDGLRGVVFGHSTTRINEALAPTVGIRYRDRGSTRETWIVRWHVRKRPETLGQKAKRKTREFLQQVLEQ